MQNKNYIESISRDIRDDNPRTTPCYTWWHKHERPPPVLLMTVAQFIYCLSLFCHRCHNLSQLLLLFVTSSSTTTVFRNDFNPISDVIRRFKIANSEWKIKLTWKTDFFSIKCLLLFFHRFQSPFGYFQTFIVGKQKRQFLSKKLKYV